MDLAGIRKEYTKEKLTIEDSTTSPFEQFEKWMHEAINAEIKEPTAMALATVSAEGVPSVRIVLLKGLEKDQFQFYTNYNSQKGRDIATNPNVSLNFHWVELERQVRIRGTATKLAEAVSTAYFHSRPRGSQIGAWASPQSQSINLRETLEENVKALTKKYEGKEIPKPAHWGGYAVEADSIEFWQGRENRLHDRVLYQKVRGSWQKERLAP